MEPIALHRELILYILKKGVKALLKPVLPVQNCLQFTARYVLTTFKKQV